MIRVYRVLLISRFPPWFILLSLYHAFLHYQNPNSFSHCFLLDSILTTVTLGFPDHPNHQWEMGGGIGLPDPGWETDLHSLQVSCNSGGSPSPTQRLASLKPPCESRLGWKIVMCPGSPSKLPQQNGNSKPSHPRTPSPKTYILKNSAMLFNSLILAFSTVVISYSFLVTVSIKAWSKLIQNNTPRAILRILTDLWLCSLVGRLYTWFPMCVFF